MRTKRQLVLWSIVAVAVGSLAAPARGVDARAGSSGTDTALPATESQVTTAGRGPFASLRVTVNQTRDLVNQAVSVTWSGANPTRSGPGRFAAHYLQLMQCWGDDDGTSPDNPGPPPEQCVQGATDAVYGGRNSGIFPAGGFALERIMSRRDWPGFDDEVGVLDDRTGFLWKPFRSVDGTVIDTHYDPGFNPAVVGGNYWQNPYFSSITSNEIAAGRTGSDGKGSDLFEVTTGAESSGLGCGQAVLAVPGGAPRVPRCWLVVVPRGDPDDENVGTPFASNADQVGVYTSPLSRRAWQHRIAIPLEFNPVDSACELSADQRQIVGSELLLVATSSWQPELCASRHLPPFVYGLTSDGAARRQLVNPVPGTPGMIVVSRPLERSAADMTNPVVYAPLALSGVVIGFNVERDPRLDAGAEAEQLRGVRVATLDLTPRLVAKLLTQSYRSQVAIKSFPPPTTHDWAAANPLHLGRDPDFLQFNEEFELLQIANGKNFGGLAMASRNSDAARQVWEWVLADPEARAWLEGQADPWGMRVNPVYATTAAANPSGFPFGDPPPDSFPKSDPYCYQGPAQGSGGAVIPPLLCGTDWLPYAQSLRDAARMTRIADDGARTTEDPFALSADKVYRPNGPQPIGSRSILSITDAPSAMQYGVQAARLSRAGDNGQARRFIAPDEPGLLAGVEAMVASSEPAVLEAAPKANAPAAYPLTVLAYGASRPLALDDAARRDYAAYVDYAGGAGQEPGRQIGELPPGYAPLPASLRSQAAEAAVAIRSLRRPLEAEAQPEPVADVRTGSDLPAPAPAPTPVAEAPTVAAIGRASRGGGGPPVAPTAAPVISDVALSESPVVDLPPSMATPAASVAVTRFAVPVLGAVLVLAALGALEVTKRPRRERP